MAAENTDGRHSSHRQPLLDATAEVNGFELLLRAINHSKARPSKRCLLLDLTADTLARCWPKKQIVLGRAVCQHLREVLSLVPGFVIRPMMNKRRDGSECRFQGMRHFLQYFSGNAVLHVRARENWWENTGCSDDETWCPPPLFVRDFSAFFREVRQARRLGWQGASELRVSTAGMQNLLPFDAGSTLRSDLKLGRWLAVGLGGMESLRALRLDGLWIRPRGAISLALETLPTLPSLTALCVSNSVVHGAHFLAEGLAHCTQLAELDLSWTSFDGSEDAPGCEGLLKSIRHLVNLQRLSLDGTGMRADGAVLLACALPSLGALRRLQAANNEIEGGGARELCHSLRACTALETLVLGRESGSAERLNEGAQNDLRSTLAVLAESLSFCPRLSSLTIQQDLTSEADGEGLAAVLSSCTALTELGLHDAWLGARAAAAAVKGMRCCTQLLSLEVAGLCARDGAGQHWPGVGTLLSTVHRQPALTRLRVSESGGGSVVAVLPQCGALRELELDIDMPASSALQRFCQDIARCSTLDRVSIAVASELVAGELEDEDADEAVVQRLRAALPHGKVRCVKVVVGSSSFSHGDDWADADPDPDWRAA